MEEMKRCRCSSKRVARSRSCIDGQHQEQIRSEEKGRNYHRKARGGLDKEHPLITASASYTETTEMSKAWELVESSRSEPSRNDERGRLDSFAEKWRIEDNNGAVSKFSAPDLTLM
ncbi:hypothetical protein GWI33_020180 [Rhynchophorus ferrugineus]|uniref:Uncharacterized protein n=1 Tax=Rhynchophorus ferrugineus TaxID=354439 RepID=A0A834HRQ2_RHYFE|nr:hypothetical protein GWI33_020180 [Rhynchophorus ferrugineus]